MKSDEGLNSLKKIIRVPKSRANYSKGTKSAIKSLFIFIFLGIPVEFVRDLESKNVCAGSQTLKS